MLARNKVAMLVALVTLMIVLVAQEITATPLMPYPSQLEERSRQDIITLAARIIKIAINGPMVDNAAKRNGGTLDTLYNLPDLSAIGRR